MAAWWMAALATVGLAHAEAYYLETDPMTTRDDARTFEQTLRDAGCEGQVLRRYVRQTGWRFVVRTLAVKDADQARACLAAVAAPDDTHIRLVERSGTRHRTLVGAPPEGPATRSTDRSSPAVPATPAPWTTRQVLDRMVAAHTRQGSEAPDRVLFRFERRGPEGLVAQHVYARRGDDVYLDVMIAEGEGTSSTAGIAAGRAWLSGDETDLDEETVRQQLARFSPERVFPFVAALASGRLEDPAWEGVYILSHGKGACTLGTEGDRVAAPFRVKVDTKTWRVVEVARGARDDAVRWTYASWRQLSDGSWWPKEVRVSRQGDLIDHVFVEDLDVAPTLPESWFVVPSNAAR